MSMDPDVAAAFANSATSAPVPAVTASDPDVQAAFDVAPNGLKTWTGSPMEKEGVPEQTPLGYGIGAANNWLGSELAKGAQWLGIKDPASLRDVRNLPAAIETVLGARTGTEGAAEEAPAAEVPATTSSPQSISAAAASPNVASASAEMRSAIEDAQGNGPLNQDALSRHLEADSLPVPVQLTRGQATQNPAILSFEQNRRAAIPELGSRFNEQNQALVQNLQALRDNVGPDVYSANPVEHGDTLIQAYKDKAAAADADIAAKYKALQDANGGQFPVDAKALQTNAASALHQQLLFEHAPSAEMNQIARAAESGNMTMEQFEAMRTNLARIMRSSSDGNERAAAGVIRQQMENLPLAPGAQNLKGLADTARAAARAQFQAVDADPAYKAAISDSVSPDRFVSRFVINAPRDQVALMKQNLAGNPAAQQTMGVATIDHLRQSAGIDAQGNGNFSQAGYNRHLQVLGPKLQSLVDPKTAEQLDTLGNVARYTQAQPRGSFVNNSNTATSSMGEYAKSAVENAVNLKFGGVPVGTWTRKALQGRAAKAFARDSLETGAGLNDVQ